MNGAFGERLVGENVSLWDDGLDPRGVPMAFDFEGVPKQRVDFFDHGVARSVVYDSFTAGREGKQSTGHALPAPNTWGPMPLNLFLAAGDADPAGLLRGIERGLWVTRFHYVNVVHPTRAILTGMTRDGTFLIENGELTRPVHNLRFTQSALDALSSVEAIGRDAVMLQDEVGGTCVPALRIGSFAFSSATEF
jgi:predicted Zn-dependent protease